MAGLLLGLGILLAGCGDRQSTAEDIATPEDTQTDRIVVGFSQVGAESDWRSANTESMKSTFTKEAGYDLIFEDGQQKQANQIRAIRTFIQQEVDYIVLAPVTETGWDTVLREAKDAGIPVIIVDRKVDVEDDSLFTCFVGSDFELEGLKMSEWLNSFSISKGIAPEDIHIYSVDEVFMDVTGYLNTYHMTARELAMTMIQDVLKTTGITATAGIGTNLYLCKIAMDIVAKHIEPDKDGVRIAELDEMSYRRKLWSHKPITDFWRVGQGYAKKLAEYGLYTMGDVARCSVGKANELYNEDLLYKLFGINAELLIDHAWGYETCRMSDIKNYHSEEHSLSNGQVLMRNYSFDEALVIVREMTDNLVLDLFEKGLVTSSITLWIAYDHRYEHEASKGTVKLERGSNSSKKIIDAVADLYLRIADRYTGIRRIEVCANRVAPESYVQYSLFDDPKQTDKERHLQEAVLNVKQRYGKNAIMRGSNLLECSTYRERNEQIGGHRA